jgi:hypothetical protein
MYSFEPGISLKCFSKPCKAKKTSGKWPLFQKPAYQLPSIALQKI